MLTVPLLVIFALLFSSADQIFSKIFSDIFNFDIDLNSLFVRLLLIVTVSLTFIGAYSFTFNDREHPGKDPAKTRHNVFGKTEIYILLGSVNVMFFIFVLVQFTYLFGGEDNILNTGLTYAEYARRGFFELIDVGIISLVMLYFTEKSILKKEGNHTIVFKLLSTMVTVQVMVVMVSAFTRLSLYEQAYGFTTLRLYSQSFIVLLSVIFCLVLFKIYVDKRQSRFAYFVFISILLFLSAMNVMNPDAFIARHNLDRYENTGNLDVLYLSNLSADSIPVTIKILDFDNEVLKKRFASALYWRVQQKDTQQLSRWQSFNLSRIKADNIINSKLSELEEYKHYRD